MQNFTIVQLRDLECWDPACYLGGCPDCKRVDRCKLPGGHKGRIENQRRKIAAMEAEYALIPKKIEGELSKLQRMVLARLPDGTGPEDLDELADDIDKGLNWPEGE